MCEHCNKTSVTIEKLDLSEESACEWISEEEGSGACEKTAVYSVSEWCVEDHLCDLHAEQTERQLDEGLADFLDHAGFGSQYEMRPIGQEETCDYVSPASIQDWQPCGKRASQAKNVRETWVLCAEHAAEMGYHADEA